MATQDKYSYIITELPRHQKTNNILWNQVVGMILQIKYGNEIYNIEVIDKNKKRITIKYKDKICDINQDQLSRGGIGKITEKYVIDFRYNIGDIIEDEYGKIQILELIERHDSSHHKKEYKYKCLKCGYEGIVSELKIIDRNTRCQVCCKNSKILVKGNNTLGSLYPEMIKYLYDENDANLYLPGSNKNIKVKCPTCGHTRKVKVCKLTSRGFYCPQCYSRNSYPNKLMMSILKSLNIRFESEKRFEWSNKKQYDFYLPDYKCIIEMHGCGHYFGIFDTPLEEIQQNDKYKKDIALNNGIVNYIEIDCKKENLKYIKNSIINNEMIYKVLDVSKINFELCDNNINPNITKNILEKWEQYHNVPDIENDLDLSRHIIIRRLKICTELGIVDYNPIKQINFKSRKKVYDKDTNTQYESISECAKMINKSRSYVTRHHKRFLIEEYIKNGKEIQTHD